MISNSFAWTRDLDARDGIDFVFPATPGGAPESFLPDSDSERAYAEAHAGDHCSVEPCGARFALWPAALVADPSRARMLVFYGKISAGVGLFNFTSAGDSIAVWKDFDTPPDRGPAAAPMMFTRVNELYGNAAVVEGDDLYVYGCGAGKPYTRPCRVARVPLGDALDRSRWVYYAGGGWSSSPSDAVPVLDADDVLSVAYDAYLSSYLAVYAPPLTNHVMMRTSKRPEGPWSDATTAFAAKAPSELWVYDAHAHPEYERDGGRVEYVTYSRTTGGGAGEIRLVRVELCGS